MSVVGRLYATLSFAALPAGIALCVIWLARFEEHGPQSQGLGLAALMVLAVIAGLTVNAGIAALLAWRVAACRPRPRTVLVVAVGAAALGGLVGFVA